MNGTQSRDFSHCFLILLIFFFLQFSLKHYTIVKVFFSFSNKRRQAVVEHHQVSFILKKFNCFTQQAAVFSLLQSQVSHSNILSDVFWKEK